MDSDTGKPSEQNNILYIKNMVCNRCIMVVRDQLLKLGIEPVSVTLGEVTLKDKLTDASREEIKNTLEPLGFELIDDKRIQLIEQIKNTIIELVHYKSNDLKINLSDYITEKLNHDYSYLSKLFSEINNTTIEKYFIGQKIERVKELLVYDELSLNEIADLLNYSSTAHLSAQFKSVTGFTPSSFKKMKGNRRKPLDQL